MKTAVKFIWFIFILSGCKTPADELFIPKLELEKESVVFTEQRSNRIVVVETNIEDWGATVNEAGADWCSVLPQGANGNYYLQISVTANGGFDERAATITVTADKLQKTITVTQIGIKPIIRTDRDVYNILFNTGELAMNVAANVNYEVIVSEDATWLTQIETEKENTVLFSVKTNQGTETREAEVTFKQTDGTLAHQVTVVQESCTSGCHDFGKDVQVRVSRAESSEPGWDGNVIEYSFDDDMETMYHTVWADPGTIFPVTLTYYFDNEPAIDYLVFYPRPTGSNGSIKLVDVLVSTAASPGFKFVGEYDFGGSSTPYALTFPERLENPLAVRFIVKSVDLSIIYSSNMRYHLVIPEMKFYRTEAGGDYSWLFADDIYSELRPEITENEIWAIENESMRNYALSIYRNEYQREFRVQEYKAFAIALEEATILKTGPFNLIDNPTGILAETGQEFIVFVGETHGQNISMRVESQEAGNWGATDYLLKKGVNNFKITGKSGLTYIIYNTSDYRNAPPIKINILTGTINGYFDITKHTNDDWKRIIANAKDDHFDLLGTHAHLKFTTSHLRANTDNAVRLVEVYDSIVSLEARHLGLVKYGRERGNRCLFSVGYYNGLFMSSSAYRTNYNVGLMDMVTSISRIRSGEIWGPAHEAGHANQTRPGFRWPGIVEVSNNVSTMYVEMTFNKWTVSGLLRNGANGYQTAFDLFYPDRKCYALISGHYGEKLPAFWQLELYFARALDYTDFYPDLYEYIRTHPDENAIGQLHMNFVRMCSDLVQKDLSEFFEFWGFLTPGTGTVDDYGTASVSLTQSMINTVKNQVSQYDPPQHKIQYIRCDNVELFRNNAAIVQGSVGKVGNRIVLSNWQNVVAIEQVDVNGNLIVPTTGTMSFDIHANMAKAFAISATGERVEINF